MAARRATRKDVVALKSQEKEAQKAIDDFLTKRPTAITTKTVRGKKVKVKSKVPANVNKKYEAYIKKLSNKIA